MIKNKFFIIILAAAFVCLAPSFTLAAEGDTAWQVENFGIFQTPAKWQTVKAEEVLDRLDKMLKANPKLQPKTDDPSATGTNKTLTDFNTAKNIFDKMLKEHNVNIYQVALETNNTYYIAGLALYKENKPMAEDEASYFSEKTSKQNRQDFAAIMTVVQNQAMQSMQILPGLTPASDMDVKMLPAGKVEYLTVKNTPAYGIGTRVIVNAFGMTAPYYAKTYIFNLNGHRAYAILWCIDSERAFWDKTFKPILASLK